MIHPHPASSNPVNRSPGPPSGAGGQDCRRAGPAEILLLIIIILILLLLLIIIILIILLMMMIITVVAVDASW